MAERKPTTAFPTTRWSRVVAATDRGTPEASEAFRELCESYWYPVYAFIRRRGHGPDASADLTQDYFARLLERSTLAAADSTRGRFRAFLLADCSRFLADHHAHRTALKRGGGVTLTSIDVRDAEGRYLHEPAHEETPERLFDRAWAVTLLGEVLTRLRREYESSGRGETFDVLKGALTEAPRAESQAELAIRLGSTAGAVQVAIYRLRRRYRDLIRQVIASTVRDESDVDDEVRDLFLALGP